MAGAALGLLALVLWVSAAPLPALDGISLALALVGLGLGTVGYVSGCDRRTRRIAVVAIGLAIAAALAIGVARFG